MSTAVAPSPAATAARGSAPSLLVGSLLGAAGVLAGFVAAAYVAAQVPDSIPYADFARVAVYLIVLAAGVALGGFLARSSPAPGVRGGVILTVSIVAAAAFLAAAFYSNFKDNNVGTILAAVTLAGAAFGVFRLLVSNQGAGWCRAVDEQGWASTSQHKRNQGLTVRRWTMVGILLIGGTGAVALAVSEPLNPSRRAARTGSTVKGVVPINYHVPFTEVIDPDGYPLQVGGREKRTTDVEAALKKDPWVDEAVVIPAAGDDPKTDHARAFVQVARKDGVAANDKFKDKLRERVAADVGEGLMPATADVEFVDKLPTNRAGGTPNRRYYREREAGHEANDDATALFPLFPAANLGISQTAHVTLPLLVALLTVWLAWRTVNVPTFADFLIATEAEMNKVSWTPRKRLIQDTIVVLVCLFLLTLFLLLIDLFWSKLLSLEFIGVLPKPPTDGTTTPDGGQKLNW